MRVRYDVEDEHSAKTGQILLQGLILSMFLIFTLRLWYLQVHKGAYFAEKARENRLRHHEAYAPRGLIRDCNGVLLAVNEPAYALALIREDCKNIDETLVKVSQWTGADLGKLKETYERGKTKVKPFKPLILVNDLSFELLSMIEANSLYWPGLKIVIRPRRKYPQGPLLAHVLGYVAEANEREMEKDPELSLGDNVGKQGLEYVLEHTLRGDKGRVQMEVDAAGRTLYSRMTRRPSAGQDVSLSIDLRIQQAAAAQLEGQAGAVVVMDPFTGEILALVSQPGFDNNIFVRGLSPSEWAALRDHPMHPIQNRATQGVYPPGSVFKLIMAGCGLHENMISTVGTVYCSGSFSLGNRVFRCWRKGGHGAMNLKEAIVQSCDVYFYTLGDRLGVDRISQFATQCGFGRPTGINLPHENSGLVPDRDWKMRRFNEPWQGGETLNMSIGQGHVLVTPVQVARFLSALLNGGHLLKPKLIKGGEPEITGELPLTDEQREFILDAMVDTVDISGRGTARLLYRKDVTIGAKTGTAQVVKMGEKRVDSDELPYEQRDHAWIATWGTDGEKTYVVVVLVEHGGHGASGAGPLARAVYRELFPSG